MQKTNQSDQKSNKGSLSWGKLALFGMGSTTGTGFFLGSGLAIEKSGFSVILNFIIAATATYLVFKALANMIVAHPEKGSFRTYSKQAFGRWVGFGHGWVYWSSEILILGSQLTAIGLFTKFWFPSMPLWILASGYAVLGLGVVLLGTGWFEKTVSILAIVKLSALVMFIVLACLVIPGFLGSENAHMHTPKNVHDVFHSGITGLWTSMIYVFFCFAGIEVMGLMAAELKDPKEAPKAGRVMLITVTLLFIISLALALLVTPLDQITAQESPFVSALKDLHYNVLVHIFNGVLIVAGFSGLVASLYSATLVMSMIADDGDAPKLFAKRTRKRRFPYGALLMTLVGLLASIAAALLLPSVVYEYITTAGGLMLLYTWLFILFASRKLLKQKLKRSGKIQSIVAICLIGIAIVGTCFNQSTRPGFFTSLAFLIIFGAVILVMKFREKKKAADNIRMR